MTKEEKIQEYERKKLIEELSKMPSMVIATAYLYALNYTLYGEDVTEKWQTATQNASALEKAYNEGYHDAMEKEPKTGRWIRITDNAGYLVWECDKCGWQQRYNTNFCPDCGIRMESE